MRLTNSGTFVHGNYWGAKSVFGSVQHQPRLRRPVATPRAPTTRARPAAWFFNNSLIGDVVVVKNSGDKTVAPDNGLNGWNLGWAALEGGVGGLTPLPTSAGEAVAPHGPPPSMAFSRLPGPRPCFAGQPSHRCSYSGLMESSRAVPSLRPCSSPT